MNLFSLIPSSWLIGGGALIAAGVVGYCGVQQIRITKIQKDLAVEQKMRSDEKQAAESAARSAAEDSLKETDRRLKEQKANADEALRISQRAAAAAASAATARERLLRAASALSASSGCQTSTDTLSTGGSAADRLTDVLGRCTEKLVRVGKAADNAIIRGQLAQADYEALRSNNERQVKDIEEVVQAHPTGVVVTSPAEQLARIKKALGLD